MASSRAVANSLKILSRAFAGVVDEEKVELYRVALDDLTDDELAAAVVSLVRGHTGEWLPNPATIRRAARPPKAAAALDVEPAIAKIERLAVYNPHAGMLYPRVEQVRTVLGDELAFAYAAAGGASRMFSEDATSREIARAEFQKALVEARDRESDQRPLLPAPRSPTRQLVGAPHLEDC